MMSARQQLIKEFAASLTKGLPDPLPADFLDVASVNVVAALAAVVAARRSHGIGDSREQVIAMVDQFLADMARTAIEVFDVMDAIGERKTGTTH